MEIPKQMLRSLSKINSFLLVQNDSDTKSVLFSNETHYLIDSKHNLVNKYGYKLMQDQSHVFNVESFQTFGPIATSKIEFSINLDRDSEIYQEYYNLGNYSPEISITSFAPIFDSCGKNHYLNIHFSHAAKNIWNVQINEEENDFVANGTMEFNGDGTLKSMSEALKSIELFSSQKIDIFWGNEESFGGISIFPYPYCFVYKSINGIPQRDLVDLELDNDGNVWASYSNGATYDIAKLQTFRIDDRKLENYEYANGIFKLQNIGDLIELETSY